MPKAVHKFTQINFSNFVQCLMGITGHEYFINSWWANDYLVLEKIPCSTRHIPLQRRQSSCVPSLKFLTESTQSIPTLTNIVAQAKIAGDRQSFSVVWYMN